MGRINLRTTPNLLAKTDKTIVGIASDAKIKNPPCAVLDLNDTDGLCDFIIKHTSPNKSPSPKKSTMPSGVDWTAVADVLDGLKTRLTCTLPSEQIPTPNAGGRILSADITASQANPPLCQFGGRWLWFCPCQPIQIKANHAHPHRKPRHGRGGD